MSWTPPKHGDPVTVVTGGGDLVSACVECAPTEDGMFPWVARVPGANAYACLPESEGLTWARGWDSATRCALEAANKLLRSAT